MLIPLAHMYSIGKVISHRQAAQIIGKHFPDTSSDYKNIDSKVLLQRVCLLIDLKNYKIGNIDITLCLEKPKIAPYISQMQAVLAKVMLRMF